VPLNDTDHYLPYETGKKLDVFMKNPNGSIYIGEVWPGVLFFFLFLYSASLLSYIGYTAFPDWFNPNTEDWWTEAILNWTKAGVEFDGLWVGTKLL
jgi:alpha-glucosidase